MAFLVFLRKSILLLFVLIFGSFGLVSCGVNTTALIPVELAVDASPGQAGQKLTDRKISSPVLGLYADGQMIWHEPDGTPKSKAHSLLRVLKATSAHGLREDFYLPADLLAQDRLTNLSADQAVAVDMILTRALYDFTGDFRFGRYHPEPSDVFPAFASALESFSLRKWIQIHEPEGKSYQDLRHLLRSGTLSPQQASLVALNMERLRWVPEPEYIQPTIRVNSAHMRLEMFDYQRDTLVFQGSMRAVIGRLSRKTPMLNDPITDLKFSPDWTVPTSIIRQDILPNLRANPNYLSPNQYEVRVKGVPPSQITDWESVRAEDVFVRRASSSAGPLGGVRFSMYNDQAIFLHDTPTKKHFSRDVRTYSSGCIRVAHAADLAEWISSLQSEPLSRQEIETRMDAGTTSYFPLEIPVMANLQYLTVYVNGSGQVAYTPDPYGFDAPLAAKMGLKIGQTAQTSELSAFDNLLTGDPDIDLRP